MKWSLSKQDDGKSKIGMDELNIQSTVYDRHSKNVVKHILEVITVAVTQHTLDRWCYHTHRN